MALDIREASIGIRAREPILDNQILEDKVPLEEPAPQVVALVVIINLQ